MRSHWLAGDDPDRLARLLIGRCLGGGDIDEHLLAIGRVLQAQARWRNRLVGEQVECAAGTLDAQLALQIPRNANSHVSVDKDNAFLADRQWNGQRNALPAQNLHRVGQCG